MTAPEANASVQDDADLQLPDGMYVPDSTTPEPAATPTGADDADGKAAADARDDAGEGEGEKGRDTGATDDEMPTGDVDPKSPLGKLLQREQMKRANSERELRQEFASQLQSMKDEILAAIGHAGGRATDQQQAALEKVNEAIDEAEELDDLEPVVGRHLKTSQSKIVKQAVKEAVEAFAKQQQEQSTAAQQASARRQAWLDTFAADAAVPEPMRERGEQVLDEFNRRLARFPSLPRMGKDEQQALLDEQYALAYDAVSRQVGGGATGKGKASATTATTSSASRKSPAGTDVLHHGASAAAASPDPDEPELDSFGLPKGMWTPG